MRTIVLTAALLCSTAAFAQTYPDTSSTTTTEPAPATTTEPAPPATTDTTATTTTAAAAPTTETGPTTKVLAKGEHYAVHRVLPDGTVMVKVLTGEDAQLAMAGKQPAALAAFMSQQPLTAGAGMTAPAPATEPAPAPQTEPEPQPQPQPQQ